MLISITWVHDYLWLVSFYEFRPKWEIVRGFVSSQIKLTGLWVDVQHCINPSQSRLLKRNKSFTIWMHFQLHSTAESSICDTFQTAYFMKWLSHLVRCAFFFPLLFFGASFYCLNLRSMYICSIIFKCFLTGFGWKRNCFFSSALSVTILFREVKNQNAHTSRPLASLLDLWQLCNWQLIVVQSCISSNSSRIKGCVHKTFYLATNSSPK